MPAPSLSQDLTALLQSTFGHTTFRANQQAVCEAASLGRDVLLVMPTGAGKSLCYQLPAIARQFAGNRSAALVISPLIALMDDQAAKLSALGLKVARIHSGLDREQSRQACRDYLDGNLQFLFIAPERMRVPGFPEMLAKRKPALIAIDEAHCISAWGHDFRPDYRTLGEHLPSLRPAPVIALTATATPTVQRDIVAQLRLADPALFIHGFRRHNLAIEAVELSKPRRNEFVVNLLKPAAARPAIVYAPSRKAAEELAQLLGGSAAAYHAGLDPGTRDRVQTAFLAGKIDTVVATIAFGMGIDKADVRTVIHTALPASVEAFYQEIGRAGRDGLPSRTVLLHSFADRKMHDFFLERDYPAATELARVVGALTPALQNPEDLTRRLRMDPDVVAKSLDKLASQGAAAFDIEGNVRATGNTGWRSGYDAQLNFRRGQIDRMAAFAESQQCRMTALIQHFGDTADGLRPCGHCDFCSPESTTAQTFREPTPQEQRQLRSILRALEPNGRSTGKLFTDLAVTKDRKDFDHLLDALARAGLLTLATDTFTSKDDGRTISYKKATLTHEGRNPDEGDLPITLRDTDSNDTHNSRKQRRESRDAHRIQQSRRDASSLAAASQPGAPSSSAASSPNRVGSGGKAQGRPSPPHPTPTTPDLTPAQQTLDTALRAWRKSEAAKAGKPAFFLLYDRTLTAITLAAPQTLPDLQRIPGIGPDKAEKYGPDLLAITRKERRASSTENDQADASHLASAPKPGAPFSSAASSPNRVGSGGKATRQTPPTSNPVTVPPSNPTPPDHPLTPAQQALDQRLRTWRAAEAERLNLPQFFVLGASTLRSLVLRHPRTLADLRSIEGLGPEKSERFGPAILDLLNP